MTTTTQNGSIAVTGDNGLRGTISRTPTEGPTAPPLEVSLADGQVIEAPANLFQRQADGTYYLPLSYDDLAETPADPQASRVPLVEEQLQVRKRLVETGRVRVIKSVETHNEVVDLPLQRREVSVVRVPVDRFVSEAPPIRYEGNVMIVSVVEEVLVVEKRLKVREELRVTTLTTETHAPQTVTLRKETARVERVPAE